MLCVGGRGFEAVGMRWSLLPFDEETAVSEGSAPDKERRRVEDDGQLVSARSVLASSPLVVQCSIPLSLS